MMIKSFKIYGIIFLLLIPFHELIENLISSVFVLTIFDKVESNFLNDIVVFSLGGFLTFSLISSLRRNVFISDKYIFILTSLAFVYVYYRFFGNIWGFVQFKITSRIVYTDLFLLFVIYEWLKKLCYKSRIGSVDPAKGFVLDDPLGLHDEDRLKREGYAESLCLKIKNTENGKSAFSIGINGEWGVGKTSFFELIKRNLNNSEYIIFDFNPWLNDGSKSIISEFFKLLSVEVYKYNSSLSKKVEQYGNLLLRFEDSSINKVIKPILYLNSINNVVQNQYEEINNSILRLNKKLIIFIDDIDRLDNDEIVEVIRIIRNTANFANTIFIAAYDRNYLINALNKINSHNSEFFLEKIFQVEVHLPEYDIKTVRKRLYDLIESNLTSKDKETLKSLFFDKRYSYYFSYAHKYSDNIIRTMRDATRLANSFNLSYSHLRGEVSIKDLYYLELLKYKYPGVYGLILKEKDRFLTLADEDNLAAGFPGYSFYSLRKNKLKKANNNEEPVFDFRYLIESYLVENDTLVGVQKKSISTIVDILEFLFPEKKVAYNNKLEPLSMADPKCFDRYSYYRLLDSNLSQVEFQTYQHEDPYDFDLKMRDWVSMGLRREIEDKFIHIKEFQSKEEFEKVILAIFNFARIPKQEDIENDYSDYDYHDLMNKINNIEGRISVKFYDSNEIEYSNFIKSILDNAPSPYWFEIKFVKNVLTTYNYTNVGLDKEYLEKRRLSYFSKYLNSIQTIDSISFQLYYACDTNDASAIFKSFIKEKDLDGFLYRMYYSEPFDRDRFALVTDHIFKIFGGYREFESFLNDFNEVDYNYLSEFKLFFEECKKVNFSEFVKFDFRDMPPRS